MVGLAGETWSDRRGEAGSTTRCADRVGLGDRARSRTQIRRRRSAYAISTRVLSCPPERAITRTRWAAALRSGKRARAEVIDPATERRVVEALGAGGRDGHQHPGIPSAQRLRPDERAPSRDLTNLRHTGLSAEFDAPRRGPRALVLGGPRLMGQRGGRKPSRLRIRSPTPTPTTKWPSQASDPTYTTGGRTPVMASASSASGGTG